MTDTIEGIIFILLGLLTMLGAAFNWSLVSRPGKLVNRLLGDTAARVVYFAIGFLVFFIGVGLLTGIHWFGL